MEGQQLAATVFELRVHAQQAAIVFKVAEVQGKLLLRAVHLAEIQEGCQGIDLLSLYGISAEIVGGVSRSANRGGSERRDAAVWAGGQAGVAGRNLQREKDRPQVTKRIFKWKQHVSM